MSLSVYMRVLWTGVWSLREAKSSLLTRKYGKLCCHAAESLSHNRLQLDVHHTGLLHPQLSNRHYKLFGKNLSRARNLACTFSRERLGPTGSSAQLRTPHTVASAQLFAVFAGAKPFARKGTRKFARVATRRQA